MTATIYGQQYGAPYHDTADDVAAAMLLAEAAVDQNTWCPAAIVDDETCVLLLRRFVRPERYGAIEPCWLSDDWVIVMAAYHRRDGVLADLGVVAT